MKSSQNTYDTRIGRFQDMVGILETLTEYKPTNPLITVDSLRKFLNDTLSKNIEVITNDTNLKTKREERRTLAFKNGSSNPECIEACIENISSYVAGEFGTSHPAYKQIYNLRKKIRPSYNKKSSESPEKNASNMRSSSEKSFTGLVGISKQIIQIITSLGSSYSPQNPMIQINNFSRKVDELDALNQNIAILLQQYSDSVQKRKDLYDGPGGMRERISMARNYMASFSGGKKNPLYEQVVTALKGS